LVKEIKLDNNYRSSPIAILNQWLDADMDLSNHSCFHPSLTHTAVDAYIADAANGETVTKSMLTARGQEERHYRYPYLETGTTSVDGSSPSTTRMPRGDTAQTQHIRTAYLAYTSAIIPWYVPPQPGARTRTGVRDAAPCELA
jgi:hypothetical protein